MVENLQQALRAYYPNIYTVPITLFIGRWAWRIPSFLALPKGTIHILRKHNFRLFEPPSPLHKHDFSTENKQKLPFLTSLPSTSAYVTYEWSPQQKCSEKNWQRKALDWKR